MISKDEINAVIIRLEIASTQALFILIAADGTINRQGSGEEDHNDDVFLAGVTSHPILHDFLREVDEQCLLHPGAFSLSNQKGIPCNLLVLFETKEESIQFDFSYTSESEGPPKEICGWVERAVDLTDPWYEKQKRNLI